ncbi:hypothetical protein L486_00318 [Kwoniella mangroviensis CBS 10435]|uniref:Chromatin structure-remodeling complex protein RSC7 n=1 Tax=Kwoniella mangroviensis CBS 10435 TaxID=1331196 RepID=A0A1B9IYU6_9TREE|nr:hypothetical protein L486_00318 [Kwoniella mangroviensis CBS 10435]
MSSRTRGKRAAAAPAEITAEASTSRSTRGGGKRGKAQPEEDITLGDEEALALGEAEEDDDDAEGEEEEDYQKATPSKGRKGKGRAKAGAASKGRNRGKVDIEEDQDEGEEHEEIKPSRRLRKSVSYKEVPVEEPEEEEEEDAEGEVEDAEEEEEEVKPRKRQPPVRLSSQTSNSTPRKRSRPSIKATPSANAVPAATGEEEDEDEDRTDTPYKFEKIPGGSGRGGFSVKGAAAAAARARWDKVRREKIERGEDPDEPRSSSARKPKRRREPLVPDADHVEMGSTMTIKGQEYTVGDDELVLDEDEKGNTKIDVEGRLLGGREYKLVTFTSSTRRNPDKLYTMTIDAARALGYTDSLAFLRRYPQILKLSCTADERQLLIDIGRIAGNLKHRQVTMVSVRNVFKLMGARVIKGGKWVTDDYYETEAIERCKEMGYDPGTLAENEEVNSRENQMTRDLGLGDSSLYNTNGPGGGRYSYSLTPFYPIGGPTTTFAGNGSDPFTEAGSGNKKQKLKSAGVNDQNWIYLTSKDSLAVNQQLQAYRNERLGTLDGTDLEGNWVYTVEEKAEEKEEQVQEEDKKMLAPGLDRKRSGLSHDVTRELTQQLGDDVVNGDTLQEDIVMDESCGIEDSIPIPEEKGPEIVTKDPREVDSKYHWGLGSWTRGVVRAAYEPHTHIPHVSQYTQPTSSSPYDRISYHPIISSSSTNNHNLVQSTLSGPSSRGISSVEYVIENNHDYDKEREERERLVREAEEWEKRMRRKRKSVSIGVN